MELFLDQQQLDVEIAQTTRRPVLKCVAATSKNFVTVFFCLLCFWGCRLCAKPNIRQPGDILKQTVPSDVRMFLFVPGEHVLFLWPGER